MTQTGIIAPMQSMTRMVVLITSAAALSVAISLFGMNAYAAETYTFTARGIVTGLDHGNQNVTIAVTHVATASSPTQAKEDLAGNPIVYKLAGAKFYKWENGKKVVKTFTKALPSGSAGAEVVIKGAAKGSGNFNVSWLVVNDSSFTVVGKLKAIDLPTKTIKVLVGTSTYKQSAFVNKEVVMQYSNSTKFKAQGKDVDADEIPSSGQKVRVTGSLKDANWKVTNFFDNVT